jgi:ubiquinone/menaquinone biosynthesis C-methylase UbiE
MKEKEYKELIKKHVVPKDVGYFLNSKEGRYQNNFYINFFSKIRNDVKILNIGCGTGSDAVILFNRGFHDITGIDINREFLKVARKRVPKCTFKYADVYDLPFSDEQFDVITIIATNEFIDAKRAFMECSRVLKKGGLMYFENFNRLINNDLRKIPFLGKAVKSSDNYHTYYHGQIKKIAKKNRLKIYKMGMFTGNAISDKPLLSRIFYSIISIGGLYKIFAPAQYYFARKV